MPEIILHHYQTSPFSEKVRKLLGVKGLAWRAVDQPIIMPKPDLVLLTGGYRRIPVMQVGADIYCDTQVIAAEIERRYPDPPTVRGADWAVNLWADRTWFSVSVAVIFGETGVDKDFADDREKMTGRPFDVNAMKAALPFMRPQWRAYASWMEDGLARGDFLGGTTPSLADVGVWMNVWWTASAAGQPGEELMAGLPRLAAWRQRMDAIGYGRRGEMAPGDAVQLAARETPADPLPSDDHEVTGFRPGDGVVVQADDYGRDPIEGVLVALTRDRITLARQAGALGAINVHFPRVGYVLAKRQ